MTRFPAKEGQPAATKDAGAEWYYPAVSCAYGRPNRLPNCQRYETRGKAKAEARRILSLAPKEPS